MKSGIKVIICMAVVAMCFQSVEAQTFGKLLSGAKKALEKTVTGGTVTKDALVGKWEYSQPAIKLQSDNTLADIGGEVATTTITDKLKGIYEKIGIKEGCFSITFTSENEVSTSIAGKTISGTYTISEDGKSLNIGYKTKDQLFTCSVSLISSDLSITFGGEKLLSFIQTAIEIIPDNTTTSSLESLLKNYNGVLVGFQFKKATAE